MLENEISHNLTPDWFSGCIGKRHGPFLTNIWIALHFGQVAMHVQIFREQSPCDQLDSRRASVNIADIKVTDHVYTGCRLSSPEMLN